MQSPIEGALKSPQNFVTSVYRANLAGLYRTISLTWTKSAMKNTLFIAIEDTSNDKNSYTFKIEISTWQFWDKKGKKSFKVDEKCLDVLWDFRSAKFSSSAEPASDYYVVLVFEGKMVLLIGDKKKKAFKKVKLKGSSSVESRLLYKKEYVIAKSSFDSRSLLGGEKEHDIHIETSVSANNVPEMWIVMNGIVVVHVTNLHWRFRGNETVMMNDTAVQILWDVYDWLYKGSDSNQGIFIFSRGGDECEFENVYLQGEICDECSKNFCHYVYAWKLES